MVWHVLYRPSKFTVIRAVVSSWFHALNCCCFLFAQEWCNGVLQNQFLFYTTSELLKSMMFRSSLPPLLWSLSLLTNTITEMEHHFHTLCLLLHVCKFLGTRESFCKRKEFNPPRNFFVDQTKTWLPGFYCFGTSCEVRWKWSIRTILHRNTRKYKVWQNIGKE